MRELFADQALKGLWSGRTSMYPGSSDRAGPPHEFPASLAHPRHWPLARRRRIPAGTWVPSGRRSTAHARIPRTQALAPECPSTGPGRLPYVSPVPSRDQPRASAQAPRCSREGPPGSSEPIPLLPREHPTTRKFQIFPTAQRAPTPYSPRAGHAGRLNRTNFPGRTGTWVRTS